MVFVVDMLLLLWKIRSITSAVQKQPSMRLTWINRPSLLAISGLYAVFIATLILL